MTVAGGGEEAEEGRGLPEDVGETGEAVVVVAVAGALEVEEEDVVVADAEAAAAAAAMAAALRSLRSFWKLARWSKYDCGLAPRAARPGGMPREVGMGRTRPGAPMGAPAGGEDGEEEGEGVRLSAGLLDLLRELWFSEESLLWKFGGENGCESVRGGGMGKVGGGGRPVCGGGLRSLRLRSVGVVLAFRDSLLKSAPDAANLSSLGEEGGSEEDLLFSLAAPTMESMEKPSLLLLPLAPLMPPPPGVAEACAACAAAAAAAAAMAADGFSMDDDDMTAVSVARVIAETIECLFVLQ